jgi:hypothetical protein
MPIIQNPNKNKKSQSKFESIPEDEELVIGQMKNEIVSSNLKHIYINLYIIHYDQLDKRKEMIDLFIKKLQNSQGETKFNVNVVYINEYNPETLNLHQYMEKKSFDFEKTGIEKYDKLELSYTIRALSNFLKHKKAMELIAADKSSNTIANTYNMIIEDDILISRNIDETLSKFFDNLKTFEKEKEGQRQDKKESPWSIVFMGFPHKMQDPSRKMFELGEKFTILPGCDSYIIQQDACKKILSLMHPIKYNTNVQLTYIIEKLKLKAYFMSPQVFIEGSKYGMYASTINANNVLIYNDNYMRTFIMLGLPQEEFTDEKQKEFIETYEKIEFKEHPDVVYLLALFHKKIGQYTESEQQFLKALELYKQTGGYVNKLSSFTNEFIKLYKVLQLDELKKIG